MNRLKLSPKEEIVMKILWESEIPLSITQIREQVQSENPNDHVNHSTIQLAIKNLQNKELVKVGDIVQTTTVIARAYEPTMTAEEFAVLSYQALVNKKDKKSVFNVITALLDHSDVSRDDLNELSKIIEEMQK